MIVVDSKVIASLWFPNDMVELAYKILKKDADWIAPILWRSEFRNVLALYLRADIRIYNRSPGYRRGRTIDGIKGI